MEKVSLLFGSGISIPTKLPSTEKLTKIILSGKNVIRNSDSTYSFSEVGNGTRQLVLRILMFLRILNSEVKHYYGFLENRPVNYEDLFYVVSQVRDSLTGDYDNPVVGSFIEKILPRVNQIQVGQEDPWQLDKLASETANYIVDLVSNSLWNKNADTSYLVSVSDFISQIGIDRVNIFTLNHDLIIEQHLKSQEIEFCDGFSNPINEVRWWDPTLFDLFKGKVNIYKLHGSIDWYQMNTPPFSYSLGRVGIIMHHDHWHAKNPQGDDIQSLDHHPKILAGSFNKMFQYTTGIFADLHVRFHYSFQNLTRLIVSGYSFGDKGINIKIVEWLDASLENKLIVIHKKPEELKRNARGLITNNWDLWQKSRKMIIIPEWIENISFQDIKATAFEV